MNGNGNGNSKGNVGLLYGIIIAIILGAIIGGFVPGFAEHTHILGDIFLTVLMMIVVPLVIFSMVVGITNLGDIRNLGSIGGRTVLYYMATTGISVIIGMILVNIIAPGKGLSSGQEEELTNTNYTLSGDGNLTVTLTEGVIKGDYTDKYIITLTDQNVMGKIKAVDGEAAIDDKTATVESWASLSAEVEYLTAESGNKLMVRDNQLIDMTLQLSGTGVEIALPKLSNVKAKEDRTMVQTHC